MRYRVSLLVTAIIVAAAISIFGTGCGRKPKAESATETQTTQATPVTAVRAARGDITESVTLTGSVEPIRETDVAAEISGNIAWVGAEVGDVVQRGQALVRLDTALAVSGAQQSAAAASAARARYGQSRVGLQLTREQTVSEVRQAEHVMDTARTRLRQAKTSADLTRSRIEEAISQAQTGVRQAQTQLADVKAGARTQEISQAQARVEQARSVLRLAKVNLDRALTLSKSGAVAQAQVDAAQTDYESAQSNVRVAEQALDLAKEGARSEQVRLAELGITQAQQVLTQAESQRGQIEVAEREVRAAEVAVDQAEESVRLARVQRARVTSTEAEVRAAAAGVAQAEAAYGMSRTQVRKHIIYAPISGVVATRTAQPGQTAAPGMSLIRLVNLDPVRVSCDASDLDVASLRVGQEGQVTVDALGAREFVGRIADIAPQVRSGQRIYTVRLEIPNPGRLLRAGMFARIRITTGLHRDVVLVPRDTLVERGEKRVVYAVEGNKIKVRNVRLGATRDPLAEITSGVEVGDLLVLGGQSLLANGQEVEPQVQGKSTSAAPAPTTE